MRHDEDLDKFAGDERSMLAKHRLQTDRPDIARLLRRLDGDIPGVEQNLLNHDSAVTIRELQAAPPAALHAPAAFINAIADEGTKAEAIRELQRTWNELQELRGNYNGAQDMIGNQADTIASLRSALTASEARVKELEYARDNRQPRHIGGCLCGRCSRD
jgi:hypothetical protein